MLLRGIEFGHISNSAGARSFYGQGYWYHGYFKLVGLDYSGSTFVAKTFTFNACPGHMRLDDDFQPVDRFPDCIVVKPWKGVVLNAVGLSNPGLNALLDKGHWQQWPRPFMLSFAAQGDNWQDRLFDAQRTAQTFTERMHLFRAPFALQVNFSCPNTKHAAEGASEMWDQLDTLQTIGVPLVPKFNVLAPLSVVQRVAQHDAVDAVVVSNTIPWGKLDEWIDWEGLFGSTVSPLWQYGGGGLSGRSLLPLLLGWFKRSKEEGGLLKPVIGCGGVLSGVDAHAVLDAGADAVELGSVSMLRPHRVRSIIRYVNTRLGGADAYQDPAA